MKNSYYVGVDVSSRTLDAALSTSDHCIDQSFPNSTAGIQALQKWVNAHMPSSSTSVVLESTAHYHLRACVQLIDAGFNVHLLNPLLSNRYNKLTTRKVKTDKSDARLLSEIPNYIAVPKFSKSRTQIIQSKQLNLLNKLYITRQQYKRSLQNTTEVLDSLESQDNSMCTSPIVRLLQTIEKEIKSLEKDIIEQHKEDQLFTHLSQIPGVSSLSAAKLCLLLAGREFSCKSRLVGFCGLDVSVKQSGKFVGRSRLTKRGDSAVRKLLYNIAWGLKQHNLFYREKYDELRASGRHYHEILIILARKFLHHLYGIMNNDFVAPFLLDKV